MASVRNWDKRRLIVTWVVVPVVVLVGRWLLRRGAYRVETLEAGATRMAGSWSESVATSLTAALVFLALAALGALTAIWLAGRRERERLRSANEAAARRLVL